MQLTTGRMGKLEIVEKSDADSGKDDSKIRTNIPTEESDEDINIEEENIEDANDDEI